MSNFSDRMREKLSQKKWDGCEKDKCEKEGCKLSVEDSNSVLIFDMDCNALNYPKEDKKRCDFVVFGAARQFVAIEMKSGNAKAKQVKDQIQDSIDFIVRSNLLQREHKVKFRAWLVKGPKFRSVESRNLKKGKSMVKFAGRRYPIKPIESGESLNDRLNEITSGKDLKNY